MSDRIAIRELKCRTRIGITEDERKSPQDVLVSVEICTDLRKAGASDDVKDTIDYKAVADRIQELATGMHNTIEKFAGDIARMILETFRPESVKVTVEKFPWNMEAKSVTVTIERELGSL